VGFLTTARDRRKHSPKHVDYVAEGNKLAATRLKLRFKVAARQQFADMAEELCRAAVPDITQGQVSRLILTGAGQVDSERLIDVRVVREDWENPNLTGYDLTLLIVHRCHRDGDDESALRSQGLAGQFSMGRRNLELASQLFDGPAVVVATVQRESSRRRRASFDRRARL